MDDMPEYFSPEYVSKKLHVSVVTIRRYIKEGKLKASKVGDRLYRIPAKELERFLDE